MLALIACLAAAQGVARGEFRKAADGLRDVGGIAVDPAGALLLADTAADTIWKWDGKELSAWRKKAGRPAGMRFGPDGLLYVCETKNKRVVKIDAAGEAVPVAETFRGAKFNSPADLCFDRKGGLYFTDPNYGGDENRTIRIEGVYYVPPGGGTTARVVEDLRRPHGIDVWADLVYVADAGLAGAAAPPRILRYRAFPEDPPGALRGGDAVCVGAEPKGPMRMAYGAPDRPSWGFIASSKGVRIQSSGGDIEFQFLKLPQTPTALAVHGDTLYAAAGKSLFQVPVSNAP